MVPVRSDLQELDFLAALDVQADGLEFCIHLPGDNSSAVLGRADEMVKQDRDIMALVDKAAHASRIPEKR